MVSCDWQPSGMSADWSRLPDVLAQLGTGPSAETFVADVATVRPEKMSSLGSKRGDRIDPGHAVCRHPAGHDGHDDDHRRRRNQRAGIQWADAE
jgi:hypothetical protein